MSDKQNQRRVRYVDDGLQKWLLIGLVLLEVLLIVLAIWVLHGRLSGIVEEQLYQIHFDEEKSSIFKHLLSEGAQILFAFLLVNVVALLIAKRLWAARVNRILRSLSALIDAAIQLDFTKKPHIQCDHSVLQSAVSWREAEAKRLAELRQRVQALPSDLPTANFPKEQLLQQLQQLTKI